MEQETKHDKAHWRCCWQPLLGIALWILAALSFMLGLISASRGAPTFSYNDIGWYLNAIVLALLAIPMKSHKGWCGKHGDECGCGMCGMPDK